VTARLTLLVSVAALLFDAGSLVHRVREQSGLLLFLPLARLDAPRAAMVWVLVNLGLLAAAGAARARGETRRGRMLTILIVVIAALLLQAMPGWLRPTGVALAGPVILWLAVLRQAPEVSLL